MLSVSVIGQSIKREGSQVGVAVFKVSQNGHDELNMCGFDDLVDMARHPQRLSMLSSGEVLQFVGQVLRLVQQSGSAKRVR